MSLALPPCQLCKNLQLHFANGWRYRHTDRLENFPAYALCSAADRQSRSVFRNMGFLQSLQVLFDMRPFKYMTGIFQMAFEFFAKNQGKEAAKDMTADGVVLMRRGHIMREPGLVFPAIDYIDFFPAGRSLKAGFV